MNKFAIRGKGYEFPHCAGRKNNGLRDYYRARIGNINYYHYIETLIHVIFVGIGKVIVLMNGEKAI